jgi:hypothetical protein
MSKYAKAYAIKNQWINMSLYFINFMYNTRKNFILEKITTLYAATLSLTTSPIIFYYIAYKELNNAIKYPNELLINESVCSYITLKDRLKDNNNPIGGLQTNNKWLANGKYIKTDFIKMNKTDIINIYEIKEYGFALNKNDKKQDGTQLLNGYILYKRNSNTLSDSGSNTTNQERQNNITSSNIWNDDDLVYFLKATNNNDIIKFLVDAGII